MADDNVLDYLPDIVRQEMTKREREARAVPPPAEPPAEAARVLPLVPPAKPDTPLSPDELSPLPLPDAAYEAHSRIANGPLSTLFFLPAGQLPDGFSYHGLERVRMVEAEKAGESPALLVRFSGSIIVEVRVEGRNLLALCDLIGRHLIHWLRQHPTGQDDGSHAVLIRRITVREFER